LNQIPGKILEQAIAHGYPIDSLSHLNSNSDLNSNLSVQAEPGEVAEPIRIPNPVRAIPKGPAKLKSKWGRPSEDDVPTIDVDTGEEAVEESQLSARQPVETSMQNFYRFKSYFVQQVKKVKGFEPIVSRGDYPIFMKARKQYEPQELIEIVDIFLDDPKSDEHTTLAACFSNDSLTNYARKRAN
jgi:hypothetical protein